MGYLIYSQSYLRLLNLLPSHMNEHIRKLLDDARNNKLVNILDAVEYDDIDINATNDIGRTLLHYASIIIMIQLLSKY